MYGALVLVATILVAQPPTASGTDALAGQVRQLMRELDADQLAQRQAAEAKLIALGPDVLDHLPPITSRTAAEVKERLGRVRKALESAAAETTARPTRVTLRGEMPLERALRELELQSGNRIVGFEDREATIKLDLDQVTYWEALDQILDQAGLTINPYGGEPQALTVEARADEMRGRVGNSVYAGVFRFEPTRLEATRDLRNPATSGLQLAVDIAWEPRIRPIAVVQPVDQFAAKDDQGQVVEVDDEQTLAADVEADIASVELVIPLKLPARKIQMLSSLKGRMTALVPGRVETFQFDKLDGAGEVVQRRAGVAVTLEQVRKNLDVYEVRVRVRFDDAANALESHRSWVYDNEAYLIAPNGERVESAGAQTTRQTLEEVGMAYLFALEKGPQGYKFVYKTPARILQVPVEFEIKNLELP